MSAIELNRYHGPTDENSRARRLNGTLLRFPDMLILFLLDLTSYAHSIISGARLSARPTDGGQDHFTMCRVARPASPPITSR